MLTDKIEQYLDLYDSESSEDDQIDELQRFNTIAFDGESSIKKKKKRWKKRGLKNMVDLLIEDHKKLARKANQEHRLREKLMRTETLMSSIDLGGSMLLT